MSFASDVRGELARTPMEDACCARSELTGALLCANAITWRGRKRYAVTLTASEASTVRRYFAMLKRFYGIIGQIRALSGDTLNNQTRYQLVIPEEEAYGLLQALELLEEGALFDLRTLPVDETVRYSCCKKAFVRAAFTLCGAISHPDRNYHIEIAAPNEALAGFIVQQLNAFEIEARVSLRKSKYVVYLKRAEDISDMLSLLGAAKAMMAFENVRVKKEVSNRVNRQLNCDNSNINRSMNAAEAQIRDIRYIDEELGLDKLPRTLRDMAYTRANNPEMPLAELGELMDPPLGKSGVNARLRRISAIAVKLRCGDEVRL
ncbi:MAG: DNA-binding protein WhiA [Clostridia bacterium]|nr:DNA-binding protein WhiA [Clostridia bacterium]